MTLPPKNGQVDLLLTVRVEPSERVPWQCRVRLFYKDLARRGIRVLAHELLQASPAPEPDLRPLVNSLADRVAAQAELLARRAEDGPRDGESGQDALVSPPDGPAAKRKGT